MDCLLLALFNQNPLAGFATPDFTECSSPEYELTGSTLKKFFSPISALATRFKSSRHSRIYHAGIGFAGIIGFNLSVTLLWSRLSHFLAGNQNPNFEIASIGYHTFIVIVCSNSVLMQLTGVNQG
jgi:hypothetical protein